MSDLMSTSAAHAFDHPELPEPIESGPSGSTTSLDIYEAFEIQDTIGKIIQGGYKTIALQFPDTLLHHSVKVFRELQKGVAGSGAQCYVLADSTYGSCCPDVLSCLHLPADFLVHYGHACLTPTDALPVHYVFPRQSLDVEEAGRSLIDGSKGEMTDKKGVIVVWDVAYDHLADDIVGEFSKQVEDLPISFATIHKPALLPTGLAESEISDVKGKGAALRAIDPPSGFELKDCVIWYLGEEGRSLLNLQMTHAANSIFLYSPERGTTQPTASRHLQKRLLSLHKAMSSDVFGLIVSNIGLKNSRPLLDTLRAELQRCKKKCYTLSVGRINPAKLANFEGVECFVLVGCAEGGLVDSKDFLRPIITPWELLLALKGENAPWDPERWTLDMGKVLDEAAKEKDRATPEDPDVDEEDEDRPHFDLSTGRYKTRRRFDSTQPGEAVAGETALTVRNKEFSLAKFESAGSGYLNSREFKGLEVRYGMDEPAVLEEGRSGVAKGYVGEQ